MPSIKFSNQMVVGINFEQEYEIVISQRNNPNVKKEIIKGKDLYDQFERAKEKIKSKFFSAHNKVLTSNNDIDSNKEWLN